MDVVGVVTIIGTGTGLVGAVVVAAVKITRHLGGMQVKTVSIKTDISNLRLEIQQNFRTAIDCKDRHEEIHADVEDIRVRVGKVEDRVGQVEHAVRSAASG